MIRSAQAKLKGDLSADTKEERKTDFSSLTGTFHWKMVLLRILIYRWHLHYCVLRVKGMQI